MAELDSYQDSFLGDIINRAIGNKTKPAADPQVIDVYVLFGDPALSLE